MKERERENDMTICCSFQMYYIVYVNLNRIKMRTGKKKKKKNLDLVTDNVYTNFGLILSIRSQDIEQKPNFDVNQGP